MKAQNLPLVTNFQREDYIVRNNLPVFELPSETIHFREFFLKSHRLHYTALQKAYKFQELYSHVFKQILYSVLASLLEKQEKNSVSYLACAKYQRNKHKFSFNLRYTQYSSKEFKPTPYRNNRRSGK